MSILILLILLAALALFLIAYGACVRVKIAWVSGLLLLILAVLILCALENAPVIVYPV